MRAGRRQFLGGVLACGLIPKPTWADAGAPAFLSAAVTPNGTYILCGIDRALNLVFQCPLPDRGHAAAAHPIRPEAVAFARRPGTFAVVIECTSGRRIATLNTPAGRHFYGHGTFNADGTRLFTTENDYEAGRGRIGVWDTTNGYHRIDEWDSGGIGPHDIKRLPGSEGFVVANGGIDTHPESGRSKLNLPTMRPNLAYINAGDLLEVSELPSDMHKNSIRHLAVTADGTVAFGLQWQGAGHPVALVGVHRFGKQIGLMSASYEDVRGMDGYIGSVAFSKDGKTLAATSPRGGIVQTYDVATRSLCACRVMPDACGVASNGDAFMATSGTGHIATLGPGLEMTADYPSLRFDNHLVAI